MEMMKLAYADVMAMPVGRLRRLVKWKDKLEEKKQKALEKAREGKTK